MLLGKESHVLVVLLSLLAATVANGTPTVSNGNDKELVACASSAGSDTHTSFEFKINQIAEPCNSHLSGVAAEFLKPPIGFKSSVASPSTCTKPLPAVPAALFMVLTGFLCVSLVKDRRVWLAGLVGLLWLGQAGLTTLPQLASHLRSKKQIEQQSPPGATFVSELEGACRLRSEIEGTQYIGLLHHLEGIPATTAKLFVPRIRMWDKLQQKRNTNEAPQFARAPLLSHIIQPTNCLSLATGQFISFSPAFIFAELPRGPPLYSREASYRKC